MLVGSDNTPVEVSPNPDSQLSLPVHQIMLVVNGIHILETLKLDELSSKKVYEFAFVIDAAVEGPRLHRLHRRPGSHPLDSGREMIPLTARER